MFNRKVKLKNSEFAIIFEEDRIHSIVNEETTIPFNKKFSAETFSKIVTIKLDTEIAILISAKSKLSFAAKFAITSPKDFILKRGIDRKYIVSSNINELVTSEVKDLFLAGFKSFIINERPHNISTLSESDIVLLINIHLLNYGVELLSLSIQNFQTPFIVTNNSKGYLFVDEKFIGILDNGLHYLSGFQENKILEVSTIKQLHNVINQEVIAKDNVAFRFSYFFEYLVTDPEKLMAKIDIQKGDVLSQLNVLLHNYTQVALRNSIANFNSFELMEKRNEVVAVALESITSSTSELGVNLQGLSLKDITFPKDIQEVFSKTLEEKVISDAKLYSARAQVASARALKNASDVIAGDKEIRYIRLLETLEKMSQKGRHTFVLGDLIKDMQG